LDKELGSVERIAEVPCVLDEMKSACFAWLAKYEPPHTQSSTPQALPCLVGQGSARPPKVYVLPCKENGTPPPLNTCHIFRRNIGSNMSKFIESTTSILGPEEIHLFYKIRRKFCQNINSEKFDQVYRKILPKNDTPSHPQ
jgi:hypothetical protein